MSEPNQAALFVSEYMDTVAASFGADEEKPLSKQQSRTMATIGRFLVAAANSGRTTSMGGRQAEALHDMGLMKVTRRRPGRGDCLYWEQHEVTPAGHVYARLVAGRPRFVGRPKRIAVWAPDLSRMPTESIELLAMVCDAELDARRKGR